MKAAGTWVFHSASLFTDSRDLFCSVIESPDKDDNLNMNTTESKYNDIKRTGVQFQKASSNGFSIFSCNMRSLPKNLCLLNDILPTVKESPSIIIVIVVSVCLERQWTAPEMSVRCGAASAVTVEPNSGQAGFVTVAASVRCWLQMLPKKF